MENLPRGRRSRRSSSNLNLSNISPLTTHFSLTSVEAAFDNNNNNTANGPQYSYIQGASAPSTPSILSRAPSRKRHLRSKPTQSVPGTPHLDHSAAVAAISKSKSSGHLLQSHRTQSSYFDYRPVRRNESSEWVHRAGIALTSEARESKGQSWLASRASSTSLLDNDSSDDESARRIRRGSQPDFGAVARWRNDNSDSTIRRVSNSRSRTKLLQERGGFHIDIPEQARMHPLAPEFIDEAFIGNSFDGDGVDDIDDVDEDDEDLHWSKRPRAGLGAWVDRMVGWSLFAVDEDLDSDDEEGRVVIVRAVEPPRLTVPELKGEGVEDVNGSGSQPLEDVSAWADAGWVLSLAAKALF
ncbi:hypothetical protein ABW19_dt0210339 [Dactylella cylindrospora]|nr:hypothetical protein ABW19_dt0210339 [Dactylella cylindrospora]